jgi:hypothetical protein
MKIKDKIETFKKLLPVRLTDPELLALGNDMAVKQDEVAHLENQLASVKSDFKARIDSKSADLAEIGGKIRTKTEFRDIECVRVFDYSKGEVYEERTDTPAEMCRRKMTPAELQMQLAIPTEPTE